MSDLGDTVTARRLLYESRELAESVGDRQTTARALLGLGVMLHKEVDFGQARRYYEQSLCICREIGDGIGSVMALGSLALLTYQVGDFEEALAFARDSLALRREMGAHASLHEELTIIAGLAARHRQAEAAARLYGAQPSSVIRWASGWAGLLRRWRL